MNHEPPRKNNRLTSSTLFAHLLSIWGEYHRLILLAVITVVLFSFVSSLSPRTRRELMFGLLAQRGLITLLFAFSLTTLSLLWSAGQRLDTAVFLLFNLRGHHPLWMDRVMWVSTQIGNGFMGLLLGALLYFIGSRRLAIELLLGILSLWLTVELIKTMVERSRPFLTLEDTRVIGWRERGKSFPSGHTSQAFFMTTLLAHHFHVGALLGMTLYSIAILVGFTRIYVGAHYPRDVIAGAILGSVWGLLTSLIELYLSTGQF